MSKFDPLATISTRRTPQNQPADPAQVPNSAGGHVFQVTPMTRLRRFLTIGTSAGTYYIKQDDLTREAAASMLDLISRDGLAVVVEIVEISTSGRAPKQNPAIFMLAACAGVGDDTTRKAALAALPLVCRTGTHLFLFAGYVEQFRGWGRGLRNAVGCWYTDKLFTDLAYQVVKYQNREGWSHKDLLRLAHPTAPTQEHRALFNWVCGRDNTAEHLPPLVTVFEAAKTTKVADLPKLIKYSEARLSWEMLPSEALNDRKVWSALLGQPGGVPLGALIRQLPRLTRLGLCDPMTKSSLAIVARLTSPTDLRKARIHPISVLIALRTYASGASIRGESTWIPSPVIIDALDQAFYLAFGAVQPSGKRTLLALDVSGSMVSPVAGLPISCREASAALALVTASVEPKHQIVGFTASGKIGGYGYGYDWRQHAVLTPLAISPRQRLDDAIKAVSDLPFGGTDCSLPMRWALEQGKKIDTFVTLTDSETWVGPIHVHQALTEYRNKTGIQARSIVVAMTATSFTIADPSDPLSLDISGLDSATPGIISAFSQGLI